GRSREKKFSQKPNYMAGRKRFISAIGPFGATPRIRSAMAALMPAASPMPTVWADRMPGKAKSDGDPRTHSLTAVDSSQARKFIVPVGAILQLSRYAIIQCGYSSSGKGEDEDAGRVVGRIL